MRVVGLVTGIEPLPPADGKGSLSRITVEGLSFLADPSLVEGVGQGDVVSLTVAVHWKAGKRPLHFVRSCQRVDG